MKPLPANPSKAEEIAHYNEFVNALPKGSYLYAMLHDTVAAVASNIRNDFACDPLNQTWERQREAVAELDKLNKQKAAVEEENRQAQIALEGRKRDHDRMRKQIDNLRAEARRIAEA